MESRTEENRHLVSKAFQAWNEGTGRIADLFADDLAWRIEGGSHASGDYAGKQALMTRLLIPFAAMFSADQPFRPSAQSVFADGDNVIVSWDGQGIAIDGRPYENRAVWILTLRAGKIVAGVVFWNDNAYDDLVERTKRTSGATPLS